jgi:hypothetical protein
MKTLVASRKGKMRRMKTPFAAEGACGEAVVSGSAPAAIAAGREGNIEQGGAHVWDGSGGGGGGGKTTASLRAEANNGWDRALGGCLVISFHPNILHPIPSNICGYIHSIKYK